MSFGISGIDNDGTLLEYDYHEVRMTRAIIAHFRRVPLVTDHSKFGRSALVRQGPMSLVDDLYTGRPPPGQRVEVISRAGTRLYVAGERDGAPRRDRAVR